MFLIPFRSQTWCSAFCGWLTKLMEVIIFYSSKKKKTKRKKKIRCSEYLGPWKSQIDCQDVLSPCSTFLCSKHKISSQPIYVLSKGMDFCNVYDTSILPGKSSKLPLFMESFQRKKQRGNHPPLLLQLAHAQQKPNHQYLLKASSDAKPTGFWDGWKCGFPSHYSCIQYTCLPRTHLFMSWSKVRSLRNMLFPMPPLWGTLASLWLQGITIPPIQTSLSSPPVIPENDVPPLVSDNEMTS